MYAADPAVLATQIGAVRIEGGDDLVTAIVIDTAGMAERPGGGAAVREAADQLRAYFDRRLARFDLPLAPAKTARGLELRAALVAIPFGGTRTYGALAQLHGSSARAIGAVCRTNPLPILVPCHRVVSTGPREFYSAGAGLATKRLLLTHERDWRK